MKKLLLLFISLATLSAHGMISGPVKSIANGFHWAGKNFRGAGKWANQASKDAVKFERKVGNNVQALLGSMRIQGVSLPVCFSTVKMYVGATGAQVAQIAARFQESQKSYLTAMQAVVMGKVENTKLDLADLQKTLTPDRERIKRLWYGTENELPMVVKNDQPL